MQIDEAGRNARAGAAPAIAEPNVGTAGILGQDGAGAGSDEDAEGTKGREAGGDEGGGTDTAEVDFSGFLPVGVEILKAIGADSISLAGNARANTPSGRAKWPDEGTAGNVGAGGPDASVNTRSKFDGAFSS